jgi:hypothetical protein
VKRGRGSKLLGFEEEEKYERSGKIMFNIYDFTPYNYLINRG